jgi:hypothetical protein
MIATTRKRMLLYFVLASTLFAVGLSPKEGWTQPTLNLPVVPVTMAAYKNDPISKFSIVLSNVPAGYDVYNRAYLGWCIEEFIFLTEGVEYDVYLYSSYDPALPVALQDDDWDMVNYILNHKQGDAIDIQNATWYFIDGGNMPSSSEGQAMVNDALANGEGFIPEPGQVIAVICADETQNVIIELRLPRLVGGEILAVDALRLVAPFLPLSILVVAGTIGVLFKRLR